MADRLDTAAGRELLDQLGFLLVPGPPAVPAPAYLFAAIRRRPTLAHFDPERIDYWVSSAGHGTPVSLEWSTVLPAASQYAWGVIQIVDRLGVSNEFVSFGGQLLVAKVEGLKVVVFSSEAPIVARGGHSQAWEPWSQEIHGYLGRLRGAADPRGELERRLAALSPVALYASFVADSLERYRASEASFGWAPAGLVVLGRERKRLRAGAPAEWAAGVELARQLGPSPIGG